MLRKKKLNDRGSALIVVIISMLLVGIIASIVLTLATGNLHDIDTTVKSTDNFYSTEKAFDELKDHLDQFARQAVEKAYKEYLQTYEYSYSDPMNGSDSSADFKELFKKYFEELVAEYIDYPGNPTSDADKKSIRDLLYGYDYDISEIIEVSVPELDPSEENVVIRNITIQLII